MMLCVTTILVACEARVVYGPLGNTVAMTLAFEGAVSVEKIPNLYSGTEDGTLTSGMMGTAELCSSVVPCDSTESETW